ncbi:Retrotransposon-derived protein PEG10 [Anabarilius grahami]|uniref:Retrotransposon-derived protein PEG10 n=1 Tax=Anabarilius grahami TaxID=495550 RepID=A0A3N0YXL4_ANAGA|nr:Retrotransposon-derived protein PEG10 [Anabarilius grahami]
MTVHILTSRTSVSAQALISSGSAGNFISHHLLQRLNIKRKRCSQDLEVHTILGKPLGHGHIRHFSPTVTLCIGCLHLEKISFMVLEGSTADIILGCLWMLQHEPKINWNSGEILQWGESCFHDCLSPVIKIILSPALVVHHPSSP